MRLYILLKACVLLVILPAITFSQALPNLPAAAHQMIDSLINEMTLEEKAGQLTLFTSDMTVTGPTMRENYKEDIQAGKVGAIFNAYGALYTRALQKIAVEETRFKIPLLFGYDVIHGHQTIFPIPLGETASWDLEAMEQSARIAAIEASAQGLHWTYAPMVDIARDPRWGRIAEGAGEDTYLGKKVAAARVKGFQGDDLAAENTILACAKHYAAYGAAQAGRDYNTVDMSELVLRETYLPPFKAALDAGVATFMTSFNELFGVPATGNKFLLTDILKEEWNFQGFVVTDYTSINEMVNHGIVANEKEAGALAINAGVDMDMQSAAFYRYLPQQVKEGKVPEAQVNDAVRRVLEAKYRLGLFDDPYRYCNEQREKDSIMNEEHLAASRDVARKSIVLLKNENHVLPLQKSGTIAVIGPLADNKKEMIGSWSAAGDWKKSVSLLEGIRQQAGQRMKVVYAKGANINDDSTQLFQEAVNVAKTADVIVLALGEEALMSGEAASRSDIDLPGVQLQLAKELQQLGKPLVVVLMNGRPLTINWLDENVTSILETWFLGHQAGNAIADVLFGDYNPSGKLPITFPRSVGQIPVYYNHKNTGRPFDKENKYTSKYLDISNTPLYPFGYGLSYTTFRYADLTLSSDNLQQGDSLQVEVALSNTGSVAGNEVVQLYIRDLVGSVTRPVKELKGFQKILLKPGETKKVTFTLHPSDLAFYHGDLSYGPEAGQFKVFVGGNSQDVLEADFSLAL